MLKVIREKNPEKLVIDLRQNRGGDYTVGEEYLINPVRALPSINKNGHLFVLISADTFSAAMNNAAQFRTQTAALLVGQEIGEKPNSYQEPRSMTLPNSHLTVRYSTRFYRFAPDGNNAIRPDHEIIPTWADYKAGSDPVLAWVLKYSAP
jgi:C-terminal processing protease CtpA/Prc